MTKSNALDMRSLKQVFVMTAVVSIMVCGLSVIFSREWALNYGIVAGLALLNWFALSKILSGLVGKKLEDLLVGIALKPLLLVFLLIYAKQMGIEITSFLAGLNTFFLCLFMFLGWRQFRPTLLSDSNQSSSITTSESGAHG
jgi:hypothetical protein